MTAKKKKTTKSKATSTTVKKAATKSKKPRTVAKKKPAAPKTQRKPASPKPASQDLTEVIMTKGKTQFDKFTQDSNTLIRESVESFFKSGSIALNRIEELVRETTAITENYAEKQQGYIKEFMGIKTLNDFAEVQHRISRANFDDFMSGVTRVSELSVKFLTDSVEPISDQMNKGMQKARETMAA